MEDKSKLWASKLPFRSTKAPAQGGTRWFWINIKKLNKHKKIEYIYKRRWFWIRIIKTMAIWTALLKGGQEPEKRVKASSVNWSIGGNCVVLFVAKLLKPLKWIVGIILFASSPLRYKRFVGRLLTIYGTFRTFVDLPFNRQTYKQSCRKP